MKTLKRGIITTFVCAAMVVPTIMPASAKITVSIEDPKAGEGIQQASLGGTAKATAVSVTNAKKQITLKKGKKKKLKVAVTPSTASQKVSYKSSKKKVVSVTKTGVLKARKKGTAKITIKTQDGSNKKCTIKVTVK
ncbi:MAG: Ig-like domain-containing protein [Lachnospiraceae bacterium]